MTKKHKILVAILGLIIILIFVGITLVAANWNQPLSKGLDLPTYAPTITKTAAPLINEEGSTDTLQTHQPSISPTDALQGIEIAPTTTTLPLSQPVPKPLCGGPPIMTILTIGIDTSDDEYFYGLADVIRVARIDFVTPKISVLAVPRDIWVQIPGISDHYGITQGKLNQSYLYGTKGMGYYDGPGEGPGLMALTLVENFDLYVDKYGSVNMSTLARFIDAVGGIDIYLPDAVDGRSIDGAVNFGYFPAGENHLTGEAAIRFSRIRYLDSDINRIDRQTQVLYALQEKILSPSVLPHIPKLITSLQDSIITNLTPKNIAALTCLLPHITSEKLIFARLPDGLLTPQWKFDPHLDHRTWTWEGDFEAIREIIGYFQEGTWPVK